MIEFVRNVNKLSKVGNKWIMVVSFCHALHWWDTSQGNYVAKPTNSWSEVRNS